MLILNNYQSVLQLLHVFCSSVFAEKFIAFFFFNFFFNKTMYIKLEIILHQ